MKTGQLKGRGHVNKEDHNDRYLVEIMCVHAAYKKDVFQLGATRTRKCIHLNYMVDIEVVITDTLPEH